MRFLAVVVVFNPNLDELVTNINSYIQYAEKIIVWQNSLIDSTSLINKLNLDFYSKIIISGSGENVGIAKALNEACKYAISSSYDWILTMDQDSTFEGPGFFNEAQTLVDDKSVGIIAASYTPKYDAWQKEFSSSFNSIQYAITSGNLVNLKAYEKVGGFTNKLFIDNVDLDYCLKLRKHNYQILITKKIFLNHQLGVSTQNLTNVLSRKIRQGNIHSPIRNYYITRNSLYIIFTYLTYDLNIALLSGKVLFKNFTKTLLYYPDKLKYFKYITQGLFDFFKGKFGACDGKK